MSEQMHWLSPEVRLPTKGESWQCPLCGVPVSLVRVAQAPTGEKGVVFDCCGNLVTFACLRDAFGIDLTDHG